MKKIFDEECSNCHKRRLGLYVLPLFDEMRTICQPCLIALFKAVMK